MPTIDKRNTVEHLYTNGTDVGIAVELSETEAQDVYGAEATAGWYVPFTTEGGSIAQQVEAEYDEDEAGQLTGKTIISSDRVVLTNTVKETDDATQDLIDRHLTARPHKYRYPLPAGKDSEGKPLHQLFGIRNALVRPGFEIATVKGKRTREIEITGTKRDGKPAYERVTVDLTDQENWPANLSDFTDA